MPNSEPIRFTFDERRAADAAGYLLLQHDGKMNYMRLIKLLYVAERESLARFGRPILGDRYVSMKHGPVLSHVYDLIKEGENEGPWAQHIQRVGTFGVCLREKPSFDSLSPADLEILDQVTKLYQGFDQFHLRDMTHEEFEEWEDPGDSSKEIPTERILKVVGKSPEEIDRIRERVKEKQALDRLFGA